MFDLSWLDTVSSMITSLTIVGGGAFWVIRQFYLKPRDKKKAKEEDERNRILQEALKPINEFIHESKSDRKLLNDVAIRNTGDIKHLRGQVSEIDDRLIFVEAKNGINRHVTYTEVYKGEE